MTHSPNAFSAGDRALYKGDIPVRILAVDQGPGDLARIQIPLSGHEFLTAYENLERVK